MVSRSLSPEKSADFISAAQGVKRRLFIAYFPSPNVTAITREEGIGNICRVYRGKVTEGYVDQENGINIRPGFWLRRSEEEMCHQPISLWDEIRYMANRTSASVSSLTCRHCFQTFPYLHEEGWIIWTRCITSNRVFWSFIVRRDVSVIIKLRVG